MNLNLKLNLCSLANNDNKTLLINNCSFPKSFLTACSVLFCFFIIFFSTVIVVVVFFSAGNPQYF